MFYYNNEMKKNEDRNKIYSEITSWSFYFFPFLFLRFFSKENFLFSLSNIIRLL